MRPIFVALVAALGFSVVVSGEVPTVYWMSAPTKPGETVEFFGGSWGKNPKLICDGETLAPVKHTETGLWFTLPAGKKQGLFDCTIVSEGGTSAPFSLNAPDLWWVQKEEGNVVRIFGRGVDAGGRARVRLVAADGNVYPLDVTARDIWQLKARIPATVPAGTYHYEVDNGLVDASGKPRFVRGQEMVTLPIATSSAIWKPTKFDVTLFGAIPNDERDDTIAIRAALEAAQKNGGGIVFFPRGRYQLSDTLTIPPHTLLKGEGRNLASLFWLDCENPPEALMLASHSFGIEDLFIHSGNYGNGLLLDDPLSRRHALTSTRTMTSHDIVLRRCKFKFIVDQWYCYSRDLFERRYFQRGNGIDLRDVRNLTIEDCDIYASKEDMSTLYFLVTGENVLMRNCRINGHGWAVIGGNHVIFENNQCLNCTYSISKISRNFYFGRNRQYDLFNNNRESVTHDGAMTAFSRHEGVGGTPGYTVAGKVEGRHVRLIFDTCSETNNVNEKAAFWKGYELQIVSGRGVGQTRRISDIRSYTDLDIDRPFDVLPDATSRFVICAERRHLLYADNEMEDSSYAIQLFGGVTDCVLARNRCRRAGGFRGEGRNYHGILPCWGVQFIGNVVEEGNSYRDVSNRPIAGDTVVGAVVACRDLSLTRAYVLRDNILENNARIEISCEDALVENNVLRHCDVGIDGAVHADTVFCRGNTFENVRHHFTPRFIAVADMPEERARLEAERRQNLEKAARGEIPMTAELAEELFGLKVSLLPWEYRIRQAIVSTAPISNAALRVEVCIPSAMPGATLELAADLKPGTLGPWHFAEKVSVKLDQKSDRLKVAYPYSLDAGPRGPFNLPLRCTLSLADGRTFRWRTVPKVFTQNRICTWEIARGEMPATGWKRVTHYNPHERIETYREFPGIKPGEKVTVRVKMKVTQPVYIDFASEGLDMRLYDAQHKPMRWFAAAPILYKPGDYEINVVKTYRKDPADSGVFKLFLRDFNADVPPGALAFYLQ